MARGGIQPGAGRPPGLKNKKTIRLEKMQEAFMETYIATVEKEIQPLAKALIKKGLKGDVPAIKEAFDRAMGKVPDKFPGGGGEIPQPILIQHNVFLHEGNSENRQPQEETEDSIGGNGSEQNNLNPNLIDNLKSAGQNPNPDLDSLGELPSPQQGSDEGLSSDSQDPRVLQGQSLEQN